jgi:hypothetical protein
MNYSTCFALIKVSLYSNLFCLYQGFSVFKPLLPLSRFLCIQTSSALIKVSLYSTRFSKSFQNFPSKAVSLAIASPSSRFAKIVAHQLQK